MPFVRIMVDGLDQIVDSLNRADHNIDTTRRTVLQQVSDSFVLSLKSKAHVITGRMRDSARSQPIDKYSYLVEVSAPYAAYENARKGSKAALGAHNFADRAEQEIRSKFGSIISSAYGTMFNSL